MHVFPLTEPYATMPPFVCVTKCNRRVCLGTHLRWAYMACTAMLIAEVNVNVICQQGTPGVGLIALAEQV